MDRTFISAEIKVLMNLIILGSGTCVPSLTRNAPGYYLEVCGKHCIIDCGSGILRQLERSGKSYKDIDAIFITHTHPDHVSDCMPFIHALIATPDFKREKILSIIGPRGLTAFYESFMGSIMKKPKTFVIEVIEIEDKFHLDCLHVFSKKTVHSENSIAFRFECEKKSIVITGDCDYDKGVIELARDADILVIDCSFPDAMKSSGHLTPKECGLIAKKANVKKLILSHLYPAPYSDSARLEECRAVFNGNLSLAEDLMELKI